ncbi:Ferric reductase-like transmembrane component [Pleodorina starrii]|nr:Ferric reductase-like transmembrane component [Pleodorina starrii]GLC75558.1 Ferric reductase-like transmembrane component [Pleodorina starrii]
MSRNAQWFPGARRRGLSQQQSQDQEQHTSYLPDQAALWDAYETKHLVDTRRQRLAKHFLSASKRSCGICWSQMTTPTRIWPPLAVLLTGVVLTCGIWLSEESSFLGLLWPLHNIISAPAATNILLFVLAGASYALFAPRAWRGVHQGRPILPLQAKTLIFFAWLLLNLFWFIAGIRGRDFRKPSWLVQSRVPSRAQHFSGPMLRLLRLLYGVGMASAWPLLANLAVVLLPGADRGLLLLVGLGAGHEEGVAAHALCGTAVWAWAAAHALLTQAPMLAAGLWSVIMLPPRDGSETKAVRNFMGLLAFLCMCGLGVSSLAALRRRSFNVFMWLHWLLAPATLLFACLHDGNIFWYGMLGAVLYAADLAQRWALRRRAAVATATLYPLPPGATEAPVKQAPTRQWAVAPLLPAAASGAGAGAGVGFGAGGSTYQYVVLRIHTGCAPGCFAGQHVWIQVPAVSRWEWHPYSVAAHDDGSFAVVVKAGGDWERRLCRHVELAAAAAAAEGSCSNSTRLNVVYEGLYGTPDLQSAAVAADRVLLFAGGAGITPVLSVLQALLTAAPPPQPQPAAAERSAKGWAAADGWLDPRPVSPAAPAAPGDQQQVQGGSGSPGEGGPPPGLAAPGCVDAAAADARGVGVWAAAGAAAAAAAEAVAAAASSGARVHLVWAVTQQTDTQPVLPLLRAAASRGWRIDLHCTRLLPSADPPAPPAEQVAIVCRHARDAAAGHGCLPAASPQSAPAAFAGGGVAGAAAVAAAPPPRLLWQLHGAACWAVAALAAVLGAAGANLGGAAASVHSCNVAGPAAAAASDGGGGGGSSTSEWVASVHAAFGAHAAAAGWARRLLEAALRGSSAASVFRCPNSLMPWSEHVRAAAGAAADGVSRIAERAAKAAGGKDVSLRVCRAWWGGVGAPELCVKCDPFKPPASELERAWPCCQARVCFFAAHLAPLLGWVAGVALGAALACAVWRWWSTAAAAAAAGRGDGGRKGRPLLAARGAGSWFGAGVSAGEAAARPLLPREGGGGADLGMPAAAAGEREMEEGAAGAVGADAGAPGLEAMVSALLADVSGRSDGEGFAAGAGTGGVFVHVGRPDVDAYIRAAAATGDAAGCGRYGRAAYGDAVYGVVVCGPESLQAAAQAAYERYLRKAYPDSWFRGFSFTT